VAKASKQTASRVEDMGVLESRSEELGGYTVEFTTFREDADATPFFKGLPNDRCQSPHWGYVLRGTLMFTFADHEETYEAGDAYYGPPGHIPRVMAGTEIVEFSPTEEYRRTLEVVAQNVAALQGG
jgi:quercetin dioxygenase-like cupin family protein